MKGKETIQTTITDLSYSGFGVGTHNGKEILVLGALPGETVSVQTFGSQDSRLLGIIDAIIEPSPHRIEPREAHYLTTSPWQIVEYAEELRMKQSMVAKIWREVAGIEIGTVEVEHDHKSYHYRNAIEFNVLGTAGSLELAQLKRGRKELIPVTGSELVFPWINEAALRVIAELNQHHVPASAIKQIVIRSNRLKQLLVILYATDPEFIKKYPVSFEWGIMVYYSDLKIARNEATKLLLSQGTVYILEQVDTRLLQYGSRDFFQVNIPVFEKAVRYMKQYVHGESIIDYYSGVGSIGIALADSVRDCILVESSEAATRTAQKNIARNNLENTYQAISGRSEEVLEYITPEKVLILDPPREGIDQKLINRICSQKPKRIAYLSCKPYTQVQDIKQLLGEYRIADTRLYNFFPRTTHVESLVILERM